MHDGMAVSKSQATRSAMQTGGFINQIGGPGCRIRRYAHAAIVDAAWILINEHPSVRRPRPGEGRHLAISQIRRLACCPSSRQKFAANRRTDGFGRCSTGKYCAHRGIHRIAAHMNLVAGDKTRNCLPGNDTTPCWAGRAKAPNSVSSNSLIPPVVYGASPASRPTAMVPTTQFFMADLFGEFA